MDSIESIDAELQALEIKRLELLARKQATLEFTVEVSTLNGSSVLLKSAYNERYVEMLKVLETKKWHNYTKTWEIQSQDWNKFTELFTATFPNGKLVDKEGSVTRIENYLNGPDIKIKQDTKHIIISTRPGIDNYQFRKYTGYSTPKLGQVNIPLAEAYRVLSIIEEHYKDNKIEWDIGIEEYCREAKIAHDSLQSFHTMKDTDTVDSTLGKYNLHPFQKVGIAFAKTSKRALIGDPMGLGKTIQGLGFSEAVAGEKGRVLVVCPASLRHNWARMIINATGQNAYLCEGRIPDKSQLRNLFSDTVKYVIINYDILGSNFEDDDIVEGVMIGKKIRYTWVEYINMAKFSCILLDEAHKAKNLDAARTRATMLLEAPHVLALTGTPVLNRPGELWPTLHLLYPNLFPNYETFLRDFTWDGKRPRNIEQLREMLSTIMIRRERSDVQKDLPTVNRVQEYVELKEENKKEYNKWMAKITDMIDEELGEVRPSPKTIEILELLTRLKQVCARNNIETVVEKAIELNEEETGNWKKVIIFSQFKDVVYDIARKINTSGEYQEERCLVITGDDDVGVRMRKCDLFQQSDQYQFLVATTQVAGEGLTLTQAGFVLFNDLMWTPAAHQQAEGRAYGRINDAHGITAYYFLCGKVMEWIWELLQFKMNVIDETVDGKEVTYSDSGLVLELIERLKLG